MLPTSNQPETASTPATVDRSSLIAAYQLQVRTIRDRLAALPDADRAHLRCALDALDEAEDYLSLYLNAATGQVAA